MTADKIWLLQVDVKAAIDAALADGNIPVLSEAPNEPPEEYVRIDGFAMSGRDFKNAQRGRHTFMIHYFQLNSRSQKRMKEQVAKIASHMHGSKLQGVIPKLEFIEFPDEGDEVAHGYLRYGVTL